jgi:hypothetical protein
MRWPHARPPPILCGNSSPSDSPLPSPPNQDQRCLEAYRLYQRRLAILSYTQSTGLARGTGSPNSSGSETIHEGSKTSSTGIIPSRVCINSPTAYGAPRTNCGSFTPPRNAYDATSLDTFDGTAQRTSVYTVDSQHRDTSPLTARNEETLRTIIVLLFFALLSWLL